MVSHENYNLIANEGFVIYFHFQVNCMFYWQFTLEMKSPSIAYLLNGSQDMYWIVDLESEVHSIWDLLIDGLKNARAMVFSKLGGQAAFFDRV